MSYAYKALNDIFISDCGVLDACLRWP